MPPSAAPYCLAATAADAEPDTALADFDAVLAHLRAACDALATRLADARAEARADDDTEPPAASPADATSPAARRAGFTIRLRNRWSGEVEAGFATGVALAIAPALVSNSRADTAAPGLEEVWFLARLHPRPTRVFTDRPPLPAPVTFYLDGGHLTDLHPHQLAARPAALAALRRWLDADEFPAPDPT